MPTSIDQPAAMPLRRVGILGTASATHRANPDDNQDAGASVSSDQIQLVVVADGLGAFARSAEAARLVTAVVAEAVRNGWNDAPSELFHLSQKQLEEYAQHALADCDEGVRTQALATTLLIAAETEATLVIAYVGNGCVFHIRGNLTDYPGSTALPWSIVNILNPHTRQENGREALYRYLSPGSSPEMVEPAVIRIQKDRHFGDIIVIGTDGIYSCDQVQRGRDPSGQLWISAQEPVVELSATLRSFLLQDAEQLTSHGLTTTLHAFVADLRDRSLLDDDATVGMIITAEALAHRHRLESEAPE